MTAPVATVLMTVHNGAPYLRTAIESILAQTFQAFRFLIVDDASTDDTRDIVRAYGARSTSIELLGLPRNVGQTAALNVGLRHAESPWIARMDADDYSAPTRLEEQMRMVDSVPGLGCVGTFAWVFREDPHLMEGVIEKPQDDAAIRRQLWRCIPLIHGSLIVRRDAIVEAGGYDERYRYSADWDLYDRLLPRCRAANVPRPLLGLRRHPGQGSYSWASLEENIQIFSRLLETTGRPAKDRAMLRESLSFTYCLRAAAQRREGRHGEAMRDLRRAVRWSPLMAGKQMVASLLPAPRHQP